MYHVLSFCCEYSCIMYIVYPKRIPSQNCGSRVKLIETFPGGTHNCTWTSFGYYDYINKFVGFVSGFLDY